VATVAMVKGRLASGFCSPTLTWVQAATDASVKSNAALVNFIVISLLASQAPDLNRSARHCPSYTTAVVPKMGLVHQSLSIISASE
jgi:hypothetical protein